MSIDRQSLTQIQVENVIDYAQYISLDPSLQGLQGLHGLQALPDGTTVAFIDSSMLDTGQIFGDNGSIETAIEVHQALPEGSIDLQQCHQVVLEQPVLEHISVQQALEPLDVKPPIGKGPFNCNLCDKIFNKWNQLQRHLKTHDEDKPFRCNQCPMSYNIEDNLLLHLATHVGPDREPICPECGKKFSRVASLKAHIMMHEKEETLMCTECGDEFSFQHQLDRHMEEHREEQEGLRTYQCRQCSQEYSRLSALREHMKQHYKVKASLHHRSYKRNVDRTGFIHKCKHCHKTFQKPSQLERHERIHTGERPFVCNICSKTFNQKGALQMHMSKHTGERPHQCTFCPMTFAQKGNLRSHIKRVHTLNKEENGMIYECEECSCMFRRLGSLNAHISRAHADPGDTSQATVQDLKMTEQPSLQQLSDMNDSTMINDVLGLDQSAGDLVDGQVMHGGLDQGASDLLQQALENSGLPSNVVEDQENEVSKQEIGASATSSGNITGATSTTIRSGALPRLSTMAVHDSATGLLKRHYIRKVNGIRWHQCTYCSKEFKKPSDLVRHIRIHTHEKPYKCTQCFRAFAVKSTLTAHIKTHTGVKDFRCEVCHKMFSTQGSLKVHLRLHTGAKPFECTHCDKKFRTSAHCKAHIQSHYKDNETIPRTRRPIKRQSRHDALLTDIPLQEPILITDTGLIQQPPRNSMFPPFANESSNMERPYKCPHCRRGFKKSSHLKQHIRSHTGERPFRCNLCLRSFVSSGVLKAHMKTHSGEKSHRCVVCDAMFTTGGSLKRHMSTHSELRPFMCPYCQKTFKTSVNCKKHMKTHRHELAIQHYQSMKEGGVGEAAAGEEEGGMVEEDTLTAPQTLADLDVLQEQDIGHTTTVTQPDMQVVEMSQADLSSGGVTTDGLSLDTGLQGAFGQAIFGTNFTLVNQQSLAQLNGQTMDDKSREQNEENGPRVTVQLEGQLNTSGNSSSLTQPGTTQFTYNPTNWKTDGTELDSGYVTQQGTSISVIEDNVQSVLVENSSSLQDVEEDDAGFQDTSDQQQQQQQQTHQQQQKEERSMLAASSTVTAGRRGHRCHICSKIFKRAAHLSLHMKNHVGTIGSFQCSECSKTFGSALVLKNHIKANHSGANAFICPHCGSAFDTGVNLHTHIIQQHQQNQQQHQQLQQPQQVLTMYQCHLCKEELKNAAQLRRHGKECRAVNPDGVQTLITKTDNDENQAPRRVRRRSLVQQQQSFSAEQVSISEKILMESASEKDRISMPKELQSQGVRRGRFANMCSHCPKSFKKPSDLQRHLRIHTGEKPFVCQICHRCFTVKSTLDSHMRTHRASEKTFPCHLCYSMFSTKGSLKVHMRLHTGAKPFKCLHCDQCFRTSGHRKSHMIAHFRPEVTTKKKSGKTTQPLMTNNSAPETKTETAGHQPMFIFNYNMTSGQHGVAQTNSNVTNQVLKVEQSNLNSTQVVSVDPQTLGQQVLNVDQAILQGGQAMVPIQLPVKEVTNNDTGATANISLPQQILQSIEGGFQLHITAPISQLGQGIQLQGLESGLLQQAVQIDASVLQQLQQSGFITINPGMAPTLTADLSQVATSELVPAPPHQGTHANTMVAVSSSGGADSLIGQALTTDTLMQQQALQSGDVGQSTENQLVQPLGQASDNLIAQIRGASDSLFVQSVSQGQVVGHSEDQLLVQSSPLAVQVTGQHQSDQSATELVISSSAQVLSGHRLSDSFLSQASGHVLHTSSATDSLLAQSSIQQSAQDSYLNTHSVQVGDAMLGGERLIVASNMVTATSDSLIGRQPSHGMGTNDGVMGGHGEHSILQGIQLQPTSMSEAVNPNVIVQPMGQLQGHQGLTKAVNQDGTTAFVTVDGQRLAVQAVSIHPSSGATELGLVKITTEVDEDESKYEMPGEDDHNRMVNMTQLEQNPSMGHQGLDDDVDDDDEDDDDGHEEVDTSALIPTAEVGNLSATQQEGHERQHVCGICYKGFKRATHLRDHMLTHGPIPKKPKATPHRCNVCQKAFQKPSQVERHMRIHTGERPFLCQICSKAFNQKNALQVHMRKHSGEKPHICPYCNSSFVQSGNLKTHIKRAHQAQMVSNMNLSRDDQTAVSAVVAAQNQVDMKAGPSGVGSVMGETGEDGVVGVMEHEGMDLIGVGPLFSQ